MNSDRYSLSLSDCKYLPTLSLSSKSPPAAQCNIVLIAYGVPDCRNRVQGNESENDISIAPYQIKVAIGN